jgi:hypothetical protein
MDLAFIHPALDSLPPAARRCLARPDAASAFHLDAWFQILAAACASSTTQPWLVASDDGGLVAPLVRHAGGRGRHAGSWTNFYSCDFTPLRGALPPGEQAELLARTLSALRPRIATLHLQRMGTAGAAPEALAMALRAAGWWTKTYVETGTWHEPVAGIGHGAFLASRAPRLQDIVARATRRLAAQPAARMTIASAGPALEDALAAYLDVHARSWKPPEPYARFVPCFVRGFARLGILRIGVATIRGRPIAAQIWIVWQRRATIAKLAHDEAARHLSPGTALTDWMIARAIDAGDVDQIDFGPGDQPYKRMWLRQRRPVMALLAGDPRTLGGAVAGLRGLAGRLLGALTRTRDAAPAR